MITVKQLYNWACEQGLENRPLITTHSYDFTECGEQMYVDIAGIKQYVEFERIEEKYAGVSKPALPHDIVE